MLDRTVRIVAVAALAALFSGACAGSESGSESGKDDFIAQADAICERVEEDTTALQPPADNSSRAETQEYLETTLRISREGLADLRALDPPEEDRDTVDRYLNRLDEAIELLSQVADAARAGDARALEDLTARVQRTGDEAQRLARAYGLEECGRDG